MNRLGPVLTLVAAMLRACATATPTDPQAVGPTTSVGTPLSTPTAATAPVAPVGVAPGDVLLNVTPSTSTFGSDGYFAILERLTGDGAEFSVHDARTGRAVGPAAARLPTHPSCRLAAVTTEDGAARVLGMRQVVTEPAGLTAGAVTQQIVGIDPIGVRELWTADVSTVPNTTEFSAVDSSCAAGAGDMQHSFESTPDGRFGRSRFGDPPVVVDLWNGSTTPVPDALAVLGRWIVVGRYSDGASVPEQVDLVDPATGSVVGGSRDPAVADELSARTFGAVDTHVSVSSDGRHAVLYVRTPDTAAFSYGLAAFSLPDLTRRWQIDAESSSDVAVFIGDDDATTFDDMGTPAFRSAAGAVDLDTGEQLWRLTGTTLCSVSGSVVSLIANQQLVFVSTAGGRRIDFDPAITECPERVGDVLVVERPTGGRSVIAVDPEVA